MSRAYLFCLLLTLIPGAATAAPLETDKLLEHYRYLHQNPELSRQEANTSAYLARQLEAMGYSVTREVGGHGLVAILANGAGPTVMYRADMDALPIAEATGLPFASTVTATNPAGESVPVMHACGHDMHMTVMLGTASRMAGQRDAWRGRLVLVAQPAEEVGGGAKAMLADGLFQRFPVPDYNLAMHVGSGLPAGKFGYVSGYAMANVDSVDITIYGRGGHGAYPHQTVDPVVMAASIVTQLQTIVSRELPPRETAVVTVGSIHGGTKHNIIPDEVTLQLTVRSYADATRNLLLRRIREISEGVARTAGMPEERLPAVAVKDEYTPAVYNTPALVDKVVPVLQARFGEDAVVTGQPSMAGEDFGRYGRTPENIPTFLIQLGASDPAAVAAAQAGGPALPGLHSAQFAPAARPTIESGVTGMTVILLSLMPAAGS
ncbi:amidohydrolase [Mangrovimicrobium sediminis]|uniref:Amidohydrolase n=1 Tax=Mangrovimicrobium sediminis TaxID=2562682 RepID=A0A4Z0LZP2_9GAMM|nr:amidohydrolase [Haliea sp. SAOS-164]TGD72690.1 amidohydrolase [Haliea sp. SAOS-164]